MENNYVINIQKLVKQFPVGDDLFTALKEINLNIKTAEFTGLVGSSGSGKTTLLNIIGGLDSASKGDINVLGHSINSTNHNEKAKIRRKYMGFIFQSYNLLPVYTVYENIELPLLLNGINSIERDKKVKQAIEWVGLTDKINSKPITLSGGQCQRTAIARAIVHRPALVLADEPTANLDAENSHQIMKILVSLNKEISTSFLFATHDEKIMNYLKRIIRLEDGKIISDVLTDIGNKD
ncbi:MAG: lipoprotein-releasing system ATP-binding protein LolD [Candidatus Marinimicrobia bacterium]|nr:lipoprotein-releasing system ATP-binding protein LolD [Candidatus Neomarinimicrobiota bacterium]|tara:strand:- start:2806 stop:3516 length:711 start_codon:yes stop_codon:yes gene_type:complete